MHFGDLLIKAGGSMQRLSDKMRFFILLAAAALQVFVVDSAEVKQVSNHGNRM